MELLYRAQDAVFLHTWLHDRNWITSVFIIMIAPNNFEVLRGIGFAFERQLGGIYVGSPYLDRGFSYSHSVRPSECQECTNGAAK
jgi:hypothetical protein